MPIQLRLPTYLMPEGPIFLLLDDIMSLLILSLKLPINAKLWLLLTHSYVEYLPVLFSCWLTGSKFYLIHFYFTPCLLIVWLTYRFNDTFNDLRSHLDREVVVVGLATCIVQWASLGSLVLAQYAEDNFNKEIHPSISQGGELKLDCSHHTSGLQRPANRQRISVAGVDGEPVSGDETPIIKSDKAFVLNRKLSNDIAQTEDWSGLLNHCLTEIVKKLKAFHDFAVFSRVCIPWRLACLTLIWSLYPPHPWSIHFQDQNILNRLDDGRYVLERWEIDGRYYYGCVNGWILSIGSKHISIFNLFSRTQRNLPILSRVGYRPITKPSDWYRYIDRFILFKVGEGDDFQFFAVALFGARGFIAFTRSSGFQDWICIESDDIACCRDVVLFQEQFYALCGRGKLFLCVFDRYKPFVSLVSGQPAESFRAYKYYLVKNVDHLIAVFQYGVKRFGPVTFSIYRSDGAFIRDPIHLEGRALFISNGNSWTIDAAKVENCRTNTIYFVDDFWLSKNRNGHFIGVFDIANGKIEDFEFEMDQYPLNNVSPFSLTYNDGA